MADVADEPQYNTLAERIAALNKQKNFNTNGNAPGSPAAPVAAKKRPPPPPPPTGRPAAQAATLTSNGVAVNGVHKPAPPPLPRRDTQTDVAPVKASPPPLPSRSTGAPSYPNSNSLAPSDAARPLARRSTSQVSVRRNSASSESSQRSFASTSSRAKSTASTVSQAPSIDGPRRLPPVNDKLPPLPPSRRQSEAVTVTQKQLSKGSKPATPKRQLSAADTSSKSSNGPVAQPQSASATTRPGLPPRLSSRSVAEPNGVTNGDPSAHDSQQTESLPKRVAQEKKPWHAYGMSSERSSRPPVIPGRPPAKTEAKTDGDEPPPVPVASRPSNAQIEAAATRAVAAPQSTDDCWVCRDWSGPDNVAAQFPRETLPRNDPIGHLAHGLCHQFPSYTDKARAIFTWFHHNIAYDTYAFFNKCVGAQTPENTIFKGAAVCAGYAETYKAIANRAGLECVVVGGHGKGFGHTPLKKGERPPPAKPDGHAWNAVRIDGGSWKLLDACWGAGHICGANNLYKKEFSPGQFIWSNEKIGRRHFPENPQYQFREDGRTITWDEYFIGRVDGETPQFYSNGHEEGIAEDSLLPMEREVPVANGDSVVRFQFSKICEHWTSEKNGLGKPPLLLFKINGGSNPKGDMIPLETNGYWHWIDVYARDLGQPGQKVEVLQLTNLNGQDARGVTAKEFLNKKGRTSMSWSYIMSWELV